MLSGRIQIDVIHAHPRAANNAQPLRVLDQLTIYCGATTDDKSVHVTDKAEQLVWRNFVVNNRLDYVRRPNDVNAGRIDAVEQEYPVASHLPIGVSRNCGFVPKPIRCWVVNWQTTNEDNLRRTRRKPFPQERRHLLRSANDLRIARW